MTCMLQDCDSRVQLQSGTHFSCMRCVVEVSLVEALEALVEPKDAVRRLSSSSAATGLAAE